VEEKLLKPKTVPDSPTELPAAALGLLALGFLEERDQQLKTLPVQKQGTSLQASLRVPSGPYTSFVALSGMSSALLLPAVQKVREAANRTKSANNLRLLALAMHMYHDTYGHFPPAAVYSKEGKPLYSWRVLLLPYLEEEQLYKQFKLDEPWDSEHNRPLLARMPKVYALPAGQGKEPHATFYQGFVGPRAAFEGKEGKRLADFTDGTSNTLLIAEAAEAVPWTKPVDLPYDAKKPLPKLGGPGQDYFNAAFADGAVRAIKKNIGKEVLRALITRNGNEAINPDELP
jgi:hypothetical protein